MIFYHLCSRAEIMMQHWLGEWSERDFQRQILFDAFLP